MHEPSPSSPADSGAARLEHECDQFERDWRAGLGPRIEGSLERVAPELRSTLLRELLGLEIELRHTSGEKFEKDEYLARFPQAGSMLDQLWPAKTGTNYATKSLAAGDSMPETVASLARYRDLRFFKRGGLGVLYRGGDEELRREAVVKFINDKHRDDPQLVAQFNLEAEITSRLDHPGVVPVYGIGQDWYGRPFYIMRLIHGRELKQAIQEFHDAGGLQDHSAAGRQRLFALLEHLASACNTVAYAHDVGIVHCDIKPANIMIGKYGETFVLDWGLATSFERTTTFVAPNEPTMRPGSGSGSSNEGHRGGTLGYMSPEQLTGELPIMPTSDVYSLGATLYEILVNRSPFNGRDPDVIEQIREGRFKAPRELQSRIPRRLEAICLKALRHSPDNRYHTAKQMAADLQNWMRDEAIEAAPDRLADRLTRFARRNRALAAAGVLAALVLMVGGVWAYLARAHATQEQELRQLAEENFTTALDTFEDICGPLANDEMNNLRVFRPFADKIQNFTTEYLARFSGNDSVLPHTARMHELRATVLRITSPNAERSRSDYEAAEKIYNRLLERDKDDLDNQLRLAQIHLSQGRLLLQRNEFDQAERMLTDAADRLELLRRTQPDQASILRGLAEAYHGRAEVYLDRDSGLSRQQALEDSQTYFEKSKELREKLVGTTSGEQRRNHSRDLARSLGYLGDLNLAQGDIVAAQRNYEQSKAIRKDLYDHNQLDPEHRFQYARGLQNFGVLERGYGGRLEVAIEALSAAVEIQRRLADEFPEVSKIPSDQGSTLNLLAEVSLLAAARDAMVADVHQTRCREAATEAGAIYGRLYNSTRPRAGQVDQNSIQGLAASFVTLSALDRQGDPEKSLRLAGEAVDLLGKIGSAPTLDRTALVNLAIALSLQNNAEESYRALSEAVVRGENAAFRFEAHRQAGLATLAADPKFGPQYEDLCKRVRSNLKSMPSE